MAILSQMPRQVFCEIQEWLGAKHQSQATNMQLAPQRCATHPSSRGLFLRAANVVLRWRENELVVAPHQLQVIGLRRSLRETR